jgi:peptidoglycan-N-acetylglucosamine deacetylase
MRPASIILVIMLFFSLCCAIPARQLVVTIDDLPLTYEGRFDQGMDETYSRKLMDTLDAFHVSATGFVTGRRIRKDYQRDLLTEFLKRGNTLGNHTFNHLDLNEVTAQEYSKDILHCEDVIAPWVAGTKYFRYPYLHRGDSPEKRDEVYAFLSAQGFAIAPATIFPGDWIFDAEFHERRKIGDAAGSDRAGREYLKAIREKTHHAEDLAKRKVKREVPQILLIHMNVINGLYLHNALSWYRDEGWSFVTLDEALKDPVYAMKERKCSRESLIWLERI